MFKILKKILKKEKNIIVGRYTYFAEKPKILSWSNNSKKSGIFVQFH